MPQVNVPGVGQLNFPDSMSQADMAAAIQKNFPQIHQPAAAPAQPDTSAGHMALGAAETAGGAIANIPYGVAHALTDLYQRITTGKAGTDPGIVSAIHVPQGQAAQDFSNTAGGALVHGIDALGGGDAATAAVGGVNSAVAAHPKLANAGGALMDAATLLPIAGPLASKVGGVVSDAADSALGDMHVSPDSGVQPQDIGLKPADEVSTVSKVATGTSTKPALKIHHQVIGNAVAGNEAGLQAGATDLNPANLAQAREAPSAVLNRVGAALPDGPASPQLVQSFQTIGGPGVAVSGKASVESIQSLRDNLTQIFSKPELTGAEQMTNLRALRQQGYANAGAEDVPSQVLGKAQLDAAHLIEDHISQNLPPDANVTPEQWQAARTALAKNFTVEGALKGNNVDLPALGRIYNNNPNLMSDGLGLLGRFAFENPEVVGPVDRISQAPSLAKDVTSIGVVHPLADATQAAAGAVGRRLMTGSTSDAVAAVDRFFPKRDPAQFDPVDRTPQPPPGLTAGPMGAPPSAGGAPGGIPLADLLSHGVEQPPAPGLSAGPMGTPGQGGVPFTASPDAVGARAVHGGGAGGEANSLQSLIEGIMGHPQTNAPPLTLGDHAVGAPAAPVGDLPHVMSQGVPEGAVQRTATPDTGPRPLGDLIHPDAAPPLSLDHGTGGMEPGQRELFSSETTQPGIQHTADPVTGQHIVTSANGSSDAQESGAMLVEKRSDTTAGAQGAGEGLARTKELVAQAENRGLRYASDVSISPAMQKIYAKLAKDPAYKVIQNPRATVNPDTGNLVSDDPRNPVFIVKSQAR